MAKISLQNRYIPKTIDIRHTLCYIMSYQNWATGQDRIQDVPFKITKLAPTCDITGSGSDTMLTMFKISAMLLK